MHNPHPPSKIKWSTPNVWKSIVFEFVLPISLITDQVSNLNSRGIPASYLLLISTHKPLNAKMNVRAKPVAKLN